MLLPNSNDFISGISTGSIISVRVLSPRLSVGDKNLSIDLKLASALIFGSALGCLGYKPHVNSVIG
jgi:hypothetical protein